MTLEESIFLEVLRQTLAAPLNTKEHAGDTMLRAATRAALKTAGIIIDEYAVAVLATEKETEK